MWLTLAVFAAQSAALPPPESRDFDLTCLMASQQAATVETNRDLALVYQMAAVFYMGRIDRLATDAREVGDDILRVGGSLAGRQVGPILVSCGEFMQERGERFEQIGADVERREKAQRQR